MNFKKAVKEDIYVFSYRANGNHEPKQIRIRAESAMIAVGKMRAAVGNLDWFSLEDVEEDC